MFSMLLLLLYFVFYFLHRSPALPTTRSLSPLSVCFPASLTVSCGDFVAVFMFVILFTQSCCFTSVNCAADAHLMPYNSLVINHVSLVRFAPYLWLNRIIRFLDVTDIFRLSMQAQKFVPTEIKICQKHIP